MAFPTVTAADLSDLPWCVIGDFNDMLSSEDKRGIHDHPEWCIRGFRSVVIDSGLVDIPLEGYPFTWWKSRGVAREVEERLDRAMANQHWLQFFPEVKLTNIVAPSSYHSPILLSCVPPHCHTGYHRRFRFENSWLLEPELDSVVRDIWDRTRDENLVRKIQACANSLQRWSKSIRPNFQAEIRNVKFSWSKLGSRMVMMMSFSLMP